MGFRSSMVSKSASKAGTRVFVNVLTAPLHFLKTSRDDDGSVTIFVVFSNSFTNTFPKYKSYKKAWHKIYWHISLQTKAHKLLQQLIKEDFIPEKQFQKIVKERLSLNLYFGEKRNLSKSYSFRKHSDKQIISHRLYWDLWDASKLT